jgi:hypothetical protein
MSWTIEQGTSYVERNILTEMITSTPYLREIAPETDLKLFTSPPTRTVAGWCVDFFRNHGTAPGRHIQDIYEAKKGEGKIPPDQEELVRGLLGGLSEQYEREPSNLSFTLDETRKYFQQRRIQMALENVDPRDADKALRIFQKAIDDAAKDRREVYEGDLFFVVPGPEEANTVNSLINTGTAIVSPDIPRLKGKHVVLVNPEEVLTNKYKTKMADFASLRVVHVDLSQAGEEAGRMHVLLALDNPANPDLSQLTLEKALDAYTMTFFDLQEEDIKPRVTLCGPIQAASVNLINSAPGYGKSWLSLEIAAAVFLGRPAMAGLWEVPRPAEVLYVDGEMSPWDLRERSIMAKAGGVHVLSKAFIESLGVDRPLELIDPEVRDRLMQLILSRGFELVVLDNFYSLLGSHDLSSANDWHPINAWLLRLRARGVAIIGDHHTSKDESNPFGSISREFNSDLVLVLNAPEERDDEHCQFTIRVKKNRGMYQGLQGKKYKCVDGVWEVTEDHKETQDLLRIQVAKLTHEGKSRSETASAVGIKNPDRISQIRTELVNEGWFTEEGEGRNRKLTITELGLQMIGEVQA